MDKELLFPMAPLDLKNLSRKVFADLEETLRKIDEGRRAGHENSTVIGYDYKRLTADLRCPNCVRCMSEQ